MDKITWEDFIIAIGLLLVVFIIALSIYNNSPIETMEEIRTYTVGVEIISKTYTFDAEHTFYYLELAGSGHEVGLARVPEQTFYDLSTGDVVEVEVTENLINGTHTTYAYKILL